MGCRNIVAKMPGINSSVLYQGIYIRWDKRIGKL